jgi:formamidopyrimidine-DNA glycosylase
MPELPDLMMLERYFDATSLHQAVERVHVSNDYVLKGTTPQGLGGALKGRRFESTLRHGKNLLIETDGPSWLRLHFGMTGNLRYLKAGKPPEHTRVLFRFGGGRALAYVCQRMLGRVSLTDGPEQFAAEHGLGPDAERVGQDEFVRIVSGRRGRLKTTLMNQSVVAGLGNVYSDEVMFQARRHPETVVDEIGEEGLRELYNVMQRIFRVARRHDADARDFPRSYLVHRRGKGEECPRCGGQVKRLKINQRSCYFCPRCQRKP